MKKAEIYTEKGLMKVEFYEKDAPNTVDNFVKLSKDGTIIDNAKMKIKVFMPEMPGMPYMEYKAKAKQIDGEYKMKINFSMSGTWQYHLKFKTIDNQVHTVRGSVNI